ncbi:Myc-type [Macleaya cordata]|uniref:Myc-type n=1 Tax=Macleaya cordata TaxID=56857 RepID=A0A200PW57_MACCD|nr:Myc-type [Macleaya cordata]
MDHLVLPTVGIGPPIKRRAGLRRKQAGRGSYRGKEMGLTHLQQTLRILCSNTEWKYAVFWKLNCRARMLLTWEDAFYDNHEPLDPSKNMCIGHTLGNNGQHYLQDQLGLAITKMSCLVYSLGEGIIGQVALTGKHQWIFADKPASCSWLSSEYSDGWGAQFSAGIRTMIVVSVVPHGVVQLGSLNNVIEDINLVTLIKNIFYSLQNFVEFFPSPVQYFVRSNLPLGKKVEGAGEHIGVESPMSRKDDSAESPQLQSGFICREHLKPAQMKLLREEDFTDGNKHNELGKCFKQNPDLQTKSSYIGALNTSFSFSTGCELHEALGSSFKKNKDSCSWNESERTESGVLTDPPEGVVDSWFTAEFESKDLLEAVVGNACPSSRIIKSEDSFCKSEQSLVTTEKTPQIPCNIRQFSCLAGESIIQTSHLKDDAHHCLSSVRESTKGCAMGTPKESPSKTLSTCTEQMEMRVEPAKINRKRGRPGESCRPRPRDRQLIQDRVKELRQLVPNGSKCSIDALLARTIKHMLFLEGVTKHADKLRKCTESKLHDKGMGFRGSFSHEYGSSWAVEVESQTEVCPIIVKNFGMSREMLVEMLCEECSHFLELAVAIRGLGLKILRAVTKARGKKTWACFVVEV